ncbi:hypothetical protein D1114_11780 [Cereibacter sphaeroides]|uniref:Uncharacterized protein n=1 Tax=Cereibacter sphaeroides TaxID=1063 RepID=A0AAX1UKX3_CERSP|nr:hypothetical protein D1114_11780 [Cereibacter sphaeroides]
MPQDRPRSTPGPATDAIRADFRPARAAGGLARAPMHSPEGPRVIASAARRIPLRPSPHRQLDHRNVR